VVSACTLELPLPEFDVLYNLSQTSQGQVVLRLAGKQCSCESLKGEGVTDCSAGGTKKHLAATHRFQQPRLLEAGSGELPHLI
jgi:hypothetical protein